MRNVFSILASLLVITMTTHAQTSTWSGASGASGNWTDTNNWVGGIAPSPGHVLRFPAGAARTINTNNFTAGTAFQRILLEDTGYQLRGNQIKLLGDTVIPGPGNIIEVANILGTNDISMPILVDTNAAKEIRSQANRLNINNGIHLAQAGNLHFAFGAISNRLGITGLGGVVVEAPASVAMAVETPNTYSGITRNGGTIIMGATGQQAIAGDTELYSSLIFPDPGIYRWLSSEVVTNTSRFRVYGTLQMNGFTETVREFKPHASVDIQNGTLRVTEDVRPSHFTLDTNAVISVFGAGGAVEFPTGTHSIIQTSILTALSFDVPLQGPGNLIKTGSERLFLTQSNSFTGVLTINDGPVIVSNSWSLGATSAGTVIGAGGMLVLGAAGAPFVLTNEPITAMAGARISRQGASATTLTGPVSLPSPGPVVTVTNPSLSVNVRFEGAITGTGGLTINGNTMFYGTSHNTYAGATVIERGMLTIWKQAGKAMGGNLIVGDDNPLDDEEVALFFYGTNLLEHTADVTVKAGARWRHDSATETLARLLGDGVVSNASGALIVGFGDAAFTFNGTLQGGGFFEKIGAGKGVLNGNGPFSGEITVNDGTLEINGFIAFATTAVIPGARLTGNGTVANLFVQNTGIYQPGRSKQDGFNVMTTSNLNLAAGSIFRVAIWGGGAGQHGRASVKGLANITNAVLDVQLLAPVPVDSEFVIIDNDGAEPVNGTFAGLPGGTFTGPGGLLWEIEYGNDVTLRLLSQGIATLPPTLEGEDFADIIVSGGNGDIYADPNECLQLYIPIYNEDSATSAVAQVTLVSGHPGLVVHQPYSQYAEIAPGDHGYNLTPFQISVPSNFTCGTNLPMTLVVKTGTNAPYALPVGLPTGKPASTPQQFDDFSEKALPDEGLGIGFVFVNDFTGHLAKIEVSLHITHPALETLSVSLVAPGDILIPLALGKSGTAYGISCGMENRTAFAADADTFIGDAAAPYVGTFRPVGILPIVRGMPESDVENRWYLWVEDATPGNEGTLKCWSLFLYPAECDDGGGICEACPAPIVDSVDLMEIPGTGRLGRLDPEAGPTACGDAPAGDYYLVPGDFYYKTYTFYNQSEAETCVTVQLETLCTGNDAIMSSAHLGGYNPALVFTNVLGYIGEDPGPNTAVRSYSFTAPPLAEITIVVSAIESYTECGGFTLYVNSPALCPAEIAISPAGDGNVRLDWNTGAAGYLLQKNTDMLAPTNWLFVPDTPVVSGDRFVVTNEPIDPEAFFRLLKP